MRILTAHLFRTDKASHFTTAIAQNAIDWEHIPIPERIKRCAILSAAIIGKETIDFDLYFFSQDDENQAAVENDDYLAKVDLDIPSDGHQIGGAELYRLDVPLTSPIIYFDEDATDAIPPEFHLGLVPRTAGGKAVNPAGDLEIIIIYDPSVK